MGAHTAYVRMQQTNVFIVGNDAIAERARQAGIDPGRPLPFICECHDVACFASVGLTLEEYDAIREEPERLVTVPGHASVALGDGDG